MRPLPSLIYDQLKRIAAPVTAVACLAVMTSCAGYQLGSNKPAEFENIATIAVPTFTNNTLEPRIGTYFAHAVIKELQNDGTYKVADTETADAVLRCTISRIDRSQLRSARFNTLRSRELRVLALVDYELTEVTTGIVLDRGTVRGDTNIFLDPNFQLTERQAFDEVSRRVATSLVSRIAEGWPGAEAMGGESRFDREREEERRRSIQ